MRAFKTLAYAKRHCVAPSRSKTVDTDMNLPTTSTDVGPKPEQPSPALPTELWLLIVSYVGEKKDLFALCATSNRLRLIALPSIFRSVKLGHDMARTYSQMTRRYTSLQNPQLGFVVTDFRATIWEPKCQRGTACPVCDALDALVGEALLAMANLEALDIACQLCLVPPEIPDKRHSYMTQLPTRRLQTFNFHCRHCSGECLDQRESILASPFLATVQSFSYGPDVRFSLLDPGSLALANSGTLQAVRDMQFYGTTVDSQILATRPIERLVLRTWLQTAPGKKERLDLALLQSPGKLTHLIGWDWVLDNQPTFKYLRHIGTVVRDDQFIIEYMESLKHLKHLTSIDVRTHDNRRLEQPSAHTCSKLREMFPNFQKVFIHGSYCGIWEFQGGAWTKRGVEGFSVWDIIRGGCENL